MTVATSFDRDYAAVSEAAGLLDRSGRGKLALTGAGAKEFLHGQVSNDILGLSPGHGRYAALLTPKGKMTGDVRVLDTGDALLLDTERVALQGLFDTIRRFSIGYDVVLHKRTLERGLVSLIGPDADAVAAAAVGLGEDVLRAHTAAEHDHMPGEIAGTSVRVVRTDLGLDVLCAAEATAAVSGALAEAGAVAIGEDAAECVRVERGRPRYGIDIDDTVIPQEAGLNDRAVSFTKGCYVGQETVARLFYKGKPNRELRGLRSEQPLRAGAELVRDGRVVGRVTSATVSPRLGAIGLALVRREAPPGTTVSAGGSGGVLVTALPFA